MYKWKSKALYWYMINFTFKTHLRTSYQYHRIYSALVISCINLHVWYQVTHKLYRRVWNRIIGANYKAAFFSKSVFYGVLCLSSCACDSGMVNWRKEKEGIVLSRNLAHMCDLKTRFRNFAVFGCVHVYLALYSGLSLGMRLGWLILNGYIHVHVLYLQLALNRVREKKANVILLATSSWVSLSLGLLSPSLGIMTSFIACTSRVECTRKGKRCVVYEK